MSKIEIDDPEMNYQSIAGGPRVCQICEEPFETVSCYEWHFERFCKGFEKIIL